MSTAFNKGGDFPSTIQRESQPSIENFVLKNRGTRQAPNIAIIMLRKTNGSVDEQVANCKCGLRYINIYILQQLFNNGKCLQLPV